MREARPEPERPPARSAEVAAWVGLHDLGADLGEPVEVVPAGNGAATVVCRQMGPGREAEIRGALAGIAGVTVRSEPAPAEGCLAAAEPGAPRDPPVAFVSALFVKLPPSVQTYGPTFQMSVLSTPRPCCCLDGMVNNFASAIIWPHVVGGERWAAAKSALFQKKTWVFVSSGSP